MHAMEQHAGIYRSGEGLAAACAKLAELRRRYRNLELHDRTNVYNTDLLQALELGSMLDCAEAVQSAAARKESRGAHQRWTSPNGMTATTCATRSRTTVAPSRRASITVTW